MQEFKTNYPRSAECAEQLKKYPMDLQFNMVIAVSVLMAKLKRGDYNHYLINKETQITDDMIDMFAKTYLENYSRVADQVYMMIGKYEPFPKLNVLLPDNFIKKLINQAKN